VSIPHGGGEGGGWDRGTGGQGQVGDASVGRGGGLLAGFFGGGLPPAPDNLLDSLMAWLRYGAVVQPEGDDEGGGGGGGGGQGRAGGGAGGGAGVVGSGRSSNGPRQCPWELLPGPCVGLLLLHGLMAHRYPRDNPKI
jgi:hypothetical protein